MINEIIKEFDYVRVHDCMVALNWKWGAAVNGMYGGGFEYETPDIETLRKATIVQLYRIVDKLESDSNDTTEHNTSTGGFNYYGVKENKIITHLRISFEVTSWSTSYDDIDYIINK